jgi:hypothetical protein
MNHLDQLLDFMPGPYSVAKDSIVSRLLDAFALEMEVFEEDIDRMRQTHWIRFAYRLEDAKALGALMGIEPLPWERLDSFRERLLTLIEARLKGALGPVEVRRFVYQYLFGAERVMGVTLVPGIQTVTFEQAYKPPDRRPLFRPLALVENPPKRRRSGTLEARGGRVPYLYRWQESNKGLQETVVEFHVTGVIGGRPAVPVIVNLSTGDLIGYAGRLALPDGKYSKRRHGGIAASCCGDAGRRRRDGEPVQSRRIHARRTVQEGRPRCQTAAADHDPGRQ